MKKLICMLLALMMVLSMAACADENKEAYEAAVAAYNSGDYENASAQLYALGDYKDASLFNTLYELDSKGLEYEVVGTGNIVTGQVPAAGTEIDKGSKLLIYVKKSEEDGEGIKVPDVRGLDYESAVRSISDAGLFAVITGDEANGVVKSQEPAYGLFVEKGTEVKINFE